MVFHKNYFYFLILILVTVWLAVFSIDDNLNVVACDAGQGDAILIQKNTSQILIDSGPDGSVLNCLGNYMPFWDRTIELVILTHPDKDHSGGLVDVFRSYKIDKFLTNDLKKPIFDTLNTRVIRKEVGSRSIEVIYPNDTMIIRIGMIYLDILYPNKEFESSKTNDYSIVTLLKYGNFKAIFTGDIEDKVSDNVSDHPKIQTVDYIKVPHHGSKNGLSEKLLQKIMPKLAVISLKKNNSYGHPHKEVLDLLEKYKVEVLRTDEIGDIDVITNGKTFW